MGLDLLFRGAIVESKFTFLRNSKKCFGGDCIMLYKDPFGLVPEVFNIIDVVVSALDEMLGVINAVMIEF